MTISQINTIIYLAKQRRGNVKSFLSNEQIALTINKFNDEYGIEDEKWSRQKVQRELARRGDTETHRICPLPITEAVKRIMNGGDLFPNEFETIQGMIKKEVAPVGHSNS